MAPLQFPSSPTTAPLPLLPTELIHHIIHLALPRLSYSTFPERYKTLKAFSLVNSTWHALAQQEIYRHILFDSEDDALALISQIVAKRAGAAMVRSVRLSNKRRWNGVNEVLAIGSVCGGLTEVWISYVYHTTLVFAELSERLPHLQTICIDYFDTTSVADSWSFLHLRTLALSNPRSPADLWFLLQSANLPQLENLSFGGWFKCKEAALPRFNDTIKRWAPQLKSFALLMCLTALDIVDAWSYFTSLRQLTLTIGCDTDLFSTLLSLIPSSLHTLRIHLFHPGDAPSSLAPIIRVLQASPACLDNLVKLIIPVARLPGKISLDEDGSQAEKSLAQERRDVLRLCKVKGVSVEETPAVRDSYYHWDDLVRLG